MSCPGLMASLMGGGAETTLAPSQAVSLLCPSGRVLVWLLASSLLATPGYWLKAPRGLR